MFNKYFILILILCFESTIAAESDSTNTIVTTEEFKSDLNQKTPWFFSVNTSNAMVKDNSAGFSASYSFSFMNSWRLTPRLSYNSNSNSENPDQDFRFRSSNNKDVVVIGGDTNTYEEKDISVELLIGKVFSLSKRSNIEPYFGFGGSKGDFESERTIETANEVNPSDSRCSNLFGIGYNCNNYRLTNELKYTTYKIILGTHFTYIFNTWALGVFADFQLRKIDYTTENSTQTQVKGSEGAIFPQSLVANGRPSEEVIRAGVGVRF